MAGSSTGSPSDARSSPKREFPEVVVEHPAGSASPSGRGTVSPGECGGTGGRRQSRGSSRRRMFWAIARTAARRHRSVELQEARRSAGHRRRLPRPASIAEVRHRALCRSWPVRSRQSRPQLLDVHRRPVLCVRAAANARERGSTAVADLWQRVRGCAGWRLATELSRWRLRNGDRRAVAGCGGLCGSAVENQRHRRQEHGCGVLRGAPHKAHQSRRSAGPGPSKRARGRTRSG